MRTSLSLLIGIVATAVLLLAPSGTSTPVASLPQLYQVCGRVFPDPHAYWPAPAQAPGRSPWAKGNAVCAASDFMQYQEMVDGLTYLQQLFPRYVTFIKLNEQFGTRVPCKYSTSSQDMCSAGLPTSAAGVEGDVRDKQELYMVRISDGPSNDKKKLFAFPLSIHGIERAGAEAGARMAEDLATWGYCEAVQKGELASNGITNCAQEGAIPHRLLEADPQAQSLTAGDALKKSAIYLVFANPDGWRRGDRDNPVHFYQRYNGNGVDLNRDWPTLGFTFRPYTPWSEPETRSFGKALKKIAGTWAGGIDLHGQLIDRAFSFTLMGASERNYAKNQRILQVVKGAWADAESRLIWSPLIKRNDEPQTCVKVEYNACDRIYGVQWGTVWDTIDYTVTGAFGDWIDSPAGLNGDGIDNEMSMSHLSNCGIGTCYLQDAEQLHVDGNKSLVYSHVNYTLLPEDARFRLSGKAAYVRDPAVISNPGSSTSTGLPNKLPQAAIMDVVLSPANSYSYEFDVKGLAEKVYNGGLEGKVTWTNAGAVNPTGPGVTSVVLERKNGPGDEPSPTASGCDGSRDWTEVNRYFNQGTASAPYVQAGGAVHSNLPLPGRWRICFLSNVELSGGAADLDITFSREKAWEDPGQKPYSVTNMKFWDDLRNSTGPLRPLEPVTPDAVQAGTANLGAYNSLIISDNPAPGVADTTAWAGKLREFVEGGGNLILTDKALKNLEYMGIVAAGKVTKRTEYAGWIGFTTTGSDETYTDPLAANIDQPGAAEGDGHRHQTYEPVPIGFSIQSASGGDANNSPVWVVDKTAWQNAGGRTVGTTGTSFASLGELALGKGKIRIIGALVPMPTEAFYHPFGLANYAVTYTGYQLVANALQYSRPA